ncbi:hypothetical protein EPUS_06486 [Endocarpon pusillum Z07020]|uniref:Uncharacterized protein n=1 Tax=Endocarpon pusillum (strain Z07020 / HMAS-L-300199) TaxID=1263415 RepID=U1GYH9_ENDPU|nr:uncharacterized protein EPUS_06486 [Endocarpon pusillum Z07020]ERF77206.1 hypothetical protein EPUS_06486 [Endocarpon pusillum Z07020]
MGAPEYRVFQLPKQLPLALIQSWEAELQDPHHCYLVLVAPNFDTGAISLEEGQWVGVVFCQGPLSPQAYNIFDSENLLAGMTGRQTHWIGSVRMYAFLSDSAWRTVAVVGELRLPLTGRRLYLKESHPSARAFLLLNQTSIDLVKRETSAVLIPNRHDELTTTLHARIQFGAFYGTPAHENHTSSGARPIMEVPLSQILYHSGYLQDVPEGFLEKDDFFKPVGTLFEYVHEFTAK